MGAGYKTPRLLYVLLGTTGATLRFADVDPEWKARFVGPGKFKGRSYHVGDITVDVVCAHFPELQISYSTWKQVTVYLPGVDSEHDTENFLLKFHEGESDKANALIVAAQKAVNELYANEAEREQRLDAEIKSSIAGMIPTPKLAIIQIEQGRNFTLQFSAVSEAWSTQLRGKGVLMAPVSVTIDGHTFPVHVVSNSVEPKVTFDWNSNFTLRSATVCMLGNNASYDTKPFVIKASLGYEGFIRRLLDAVLKVVNVVYPEKVGCATPGVNVGWVRVDPATQVLVAQGYNNEGGNVKLKFKVTEVIKVIEKGLADVAEKQKMLLDYNRKSVHEAACRFMNGLAGAEVDTRPPPQITTLVNPAFVKEAEGYRDTLKISADESIELEQQMVINWQNMATVVFQARNVSVQA